VKKKFIDEPGQMKLLIVVDKLLTGFDAPPATYLYIDKQMRDHGLFQAICRVNRLDGDDKEYGYIVDYKDLFKRIEGAVQDYTSGALDGYDKEDVAGLLEDRSRRPRGRLEEALEAVRALCEPVEPPRDDPAFYATSPRRSTATPTQLKANEPQRLALYKLVGRAGAGVREPGRRDDEAGYSEAEAAGIKARSRSTRTCAPGEAAQRRRHRPQAVRARRCGTSSTRTSGPRRARRSRPSTTSRWSSSSSSAARPRDALPSRGSARRRRRSPRPSRTTSASSSSTSRRSTRSTTRRCPSCSTR
jgi:hypothetical protein